MPTGNPLVDTGIFSIAILSNTSPFNVTIKEVAEVMFSGEYPGRDLAYTNAITKALSMILLNNPLNQPSYAKDKGEDYLCRPSKILPSPLQERLYRTYLLEFLFNFIADTQEECHTNCYICGALTNLHFNNLEVEVNRIYGKKISSGNGTSRSWFPLVGSTSSSQNFPAYAEPGTICGKCLLAVHMLPRSVNLYSGKLTCYQSDNYQIVMEFIKGNLEEFNDLLLTTNDEKLEIIGKKDGYNRFYIKLLDIIKKFRDEISKHGLYLLLFTNMGADPSAERIYLPDRIIMFLDQIANYYNKEREILKYIKLEQKFLKHPDRFLINRMQSLSDYELFYSNTKIKEEHLPDILFYELYQHLILLWSVEDLLLVSDIAKEIRTEVESDQLSRIIKSRDYREIKNLAIPKLLRRLRDSKIELQDLLSIFATKYSGVERNPWKLLLFYLHPNLKIFRDKTFKGKSIPHPNIYDLDTHTGIKQFALRVFNRHSKRAAFDKEKYLSTIHRWNISELKREFVYLSRTIRGYTFEYMQELFSTLKASDIIFWFRVYSNITDEIELDERVITKDQLIEESNIGEKCLLALDNYISARIMKIGKTRFFKEFSTDIYDYSQLGLFSLLNEYLSKNNLEKITELQLLYDPIGGSSTWSELRQKLVLFLFQLQLIQENGPETLLEQMEESK
ncbi:MAG: hypothetical protein INQ03_10650 [Candidatus Heimdallarchaeota archaeon]|nr:hypothetical protein [Candidatus Heimdallarchaeota archaeon]